MINNSKDFFYVTPTGQTHRGDDPPPPNGSTLLVAPGGAIEDHLAKKYKVDKDLAGEAAVQRDSAGEPIAVHEGRAYAVGVLPAENQARVEAMEAAKAEDEEEDDGKVAAKAEDEEEDDDDEDEDKTGLKMVRSGDAENKAITPGAEAARVRRGRPPTKR
jgi:hypothetical protein